MFKFRGSFLSLKIQYGNMYFCKLQIAFALLQEDLTPFLVAVAGNKQQIVQFLLERGANIHAVDIYKRYSSFGFSLKLYIVLEW